MRKFSCGAAVVFTSAVIGSSLSRADTLKFDDITTGDTAQVPANYGGFTWDSDWGVLSNSYFETNWGNTYGALSGQYAAYNGNGDLNISTSSGTLFNFNGAYFTGWGANNSAQSYTSTSILVTGYDNSTVVGTASMNLSSSQYTWLAANFTGVNRLTFTASDASRWFLMDNFTFNEPITATTTAAAPLPSAAWGGMALLGGLGLLRLRKRRGLTA